MTVIGIDPGSTESAFAIWNGSKVCAFATMPNSDLRTRLCHMWEHEDVSHCCIEHVRGFGLRVGNETLDTCLWTGRFIEVFNPNRVDLLARKTIVTHLCGTSKAGDKDVREAIIYRFGGSKDIAIGTRKAPGPLFGISSHTWSALAVALCWWDRAQVEGKVA